MLRDRLFHPFESRQRDGERRTLAGAIACSDDRAAMKVQDMTRDRKAESEAAVLACYRAVHLPKPLEDHRQRFLRDALTAVGERYFDRVADAPHRNTNLALRRRELDRIGEHVGEDLLQPR